MVDDVSYERRLIRPGPSTLRSIVASMPRTAVDVCSNAICRGDGKRVRAMSKN